MNVRDLVKQPVAGLLYKASLLAVSAVSWRRLYSLFNRGMYYSLEEQDHDTLRQLLRYNYYIILTRRKTALTTHVIDWANVLATELPSHYVHTLMNVEGDLTDNLGFKLIEATSAGVHWSTFMEVFDCDSVCVLKPRGLTAEEWTGVLDAVKGQFGRPYDILFDITEGERVSCVELVYQALRTLPNFESKFPYLSALLKEHGNNLTPHMLYHCGDLDIVYEARR